MNKEKPWDEIVIDAANAVLGRLAAYAAKKALNGKKVVIINSESAIITGNRQDIVKNYLQKRRRHGLSLKGPVFPTSAERILKRTIRGMLPHRQERGMLALKRIICYKGIPDEYHGREKTMLAVERAGKNIKLRELALMMKGSWRKSS